MIEIVDVLFYVLVVIASTYILYKLPRIIRFLNRKIKNGFRIWLKMDGLNDIIDDRERNFKMYINNEIENRAHESVYNYFNETYNFRLDKNNEFQRIEVEAEAKQMLETIVVNFVGQAVSERLDELLKPESLIDDIVNRINKKQL